MASLVVSIAGPADQVDLTVPAETPIGQLLPTFISLGVLGAGTESNGSTYGVARAGEPPLPSDSTLADCGVVDGTVLYMQELKPVEAAPKQEPRKILREDYEAEQEAAALERRAGFPLKRTASMLPDAPPFNERVRDAMAAFLKGDPEDGRSNLGGSPDDADSPAPVARPADLTVVEPPSRMDRARSSWRATSYLRRLDARIAEPRLRRCPTIAVMSPKGGVGKTTMTALLGSLLVQIRHERIVAVDTNPDYGSLGPALAPEHRVFVDDLVDVLEHPNLSVSELDRKLARAFDGLLVVPAPTDPGRMARLDQDSYARTFARLKEMVSGLVLDCGTGLQEPAARAAIDAADQIVLVSDSEPSTASLVAEASAMLVRSGPPLFLVINKLPRKGGRLDLEQVSRAIPDARCLIAMDSEPEVASRLSAGDFTWERAPASWQRSMRELAAVMVKDWPDLGLAA
jgi:MinD-like ATPase involved in chromosome partitioning or flagellar assembly